MKKCVDVLKKRQSVFKTMLIMTAIILLITSCSKSDNIVKIKGFDGKEITIDAEGFSKDQIQALKDVSDGTKDLDTVIKSGLFTNEQLQDMGLMPGNILDRKSGPGGQGKGFPEIDLTGIDINDLDLEGLSEDQIQAVKDVLEGKRTLMSLIDDSILTFDEFQKLGIMPMQGDRPPMPSNESIPEST